MNPIETATKPRIRLMYRKSILGLLRRLGPLEYLLGLLHVAQNVLEPKLVNGQPIIRNGVLPEPEAVSGAGRVIRAA